MNGTDLLLNDREFELFKILVKIEIERTTDSGETVEVDQVATHAYAAKKLYAAALKHVHEKQSE